MHTQMGMEITFTKKASSDPYLPTEYAVDKDGSPSFVLYTDPGDPAPRLAGLTILDGTNFTVNEVTILVGIEKITKKPVESIKAINEAQISICYKED